MTGALVALGCGGTGPRPARPVIANADAPAVAAPPPLTMPAGFLDADLAVLDGTTVVFYAAGEELVETGRIALPPLDEFRAGPLTGGWIDRDSLAVSRGDRDALRLAEDGVAPLAVPDAAAFVTARPPITDPALREGGLPPRFAVVGGAVWWSECAWSLPYDGGACAIWVNAQLWPTPSREEGLDAIPAPGRWWSARAPRGFSAALQDEDLTCVAPGATATQVFTGDAARADHVREFAWVSEEPARLLIIYGTLAYGGLDENRWSLHDGCAGAALAGGTTVDAGPGDLWVGRSQPSDARDAPVTLTVFRGATAVGAVPIGKDAQIAFRPPVD